MTAIRPIRLNGPDEKPGFDHLEPISSWFLGGVAAGATATGIVDDNRYGLDLQNSGTGGQSFRTTSGNNSYQLKVDDTGVTVWGGLTITGGGLTVASLVVLGTLSATGVATFSTGVTVGGTLGVTGAVTLQSTLDVTGAATFRNTLDATGAAFFRSTLNVTGAATFATGATVGGTLGVTGVATFATGVTVQGSFNVDSNCNLGNAIGDTVDVAGPLRVTGTATFVTNVTMNQGLVVDQSATVTGNLTLGNGSQINLAAGTIDFDLGSSGGFTNAAGTWSGYVTIKHDGSTKYVPYLSVAP